ncbi:MAG: HD domain-containing protein [Candidatus Omnitrophica bacterium]|nr:HD domain-containing protein [Candidatus Omnitrophota bacterium]
MINYPEALKNAAKSMVRFKNPDNLLRMIVRFIAKEIGLTHASILVFDTVRQRYTFIDSRGESKLPVHLIRIDSDHPLILSFMGKGKKPHLYKDALLLSHLEKFVESKESSRGIKIKKVFDSMKSIKASVCVPSFYQGELLGVLILGEKKDRDDFTHEELSFFHTLASDAAMTIKNTEFQSQLIDRNRQLEEKLAEIKRLRKKEQETYFQIMLSLAREVREKDDSTFGHLEAVEKLGLMTAEELGIDLSGKKRDILIAGLRLHDVGKIGIPDSILKKEDKLTPEEWLIMKQHVDKGVKILEPLTDFKDVVEIVRCHHEFYNGKGYPRGLKGSEIPIESSIVSVVDAFHAMISTRCYKKGFSLEYALGELNANSGEQFHPKVVEAFISALKKNMYGYYKSRISEERQIQHEEKPNTI